jgi:hypothetical protein
VSGVAPANPVSFTRRSWGEAFDCDEASKVSEKRGRAAKVLNHWEWFCFAWKRGLSGGVNENPPGYDLEGGDNNANEYRFGTCG